MSKLSNPTLKDNSTQATSASAAVQAYVQIITQQADLKLNCLPDLPTHQQKARDHATTWNTDIHPNMIQTNADIIDYANQFQSFYSVLVKYAEDVDNSDSRQKLVEGLKLLHTNIQSKYNSAKTLTDQLTAFEADLSNDNQSFQSDYNVAEVKIEGDDGELKSLNKQLDCIHAAMKKDIGLMAGGAVGLVGGIALVVVGGITEFVSGGSSSLLMGAGLAFVAAGSIMETPGAQDYDKQIDQQKDVQQQIAADKQEMIGLQAAKGQLGGFLSSISTAIIATQALVDGWRALGADLLETIEAIDRVDPTITSDFIVAELNTANSDWGVALEEAKHLQSNGTIQSQYYDDLQDAFKAMAPATTKE